MSFWYTPMPATRLALLRIGVGIYAVAYLLVRALPLTSVVRFSAAEFAPVGPVQLLAAPLPGWAVYAALALAIASGVAFTAGYLYRVAAPLFALAFLWVTAYRSSWGMVFHTENLCALHLIVLALAPAADALAPRKSSTELHGRYGWAVRTVAAITVVTYVLAGVAKLRLGGAAWVDGELLRAQVAYDNVRKIELGATYAPLGAWLVTLAWPFKGLAWMSLLLELGAPLALLHVRLALPWVLGAWSFHLGVALLMAIGFPYQLSFAAYLAFFPLERALPWLRKHCAAARHVDVHHA
ncbi:MAG TPA: HTTM domain-containing protein [Polyangiales bacterium]|nr:HTTM domain-containing protein [Polyangiales bacterium]